jgi:hypothetical protein
MNNAIFYRGLLFALCEKGHKEFDADGERFHAAFKATLEYACQVAPETPAKEMLENYDPVFGVSPEATEMVLEGERDFILALLNPRLEVAHFKLDPKEAGEELEELPSPEVFRKLAERFHERLAN